MAAAAAKGVYMRVRGLAAGLGVVLLAAAPAGAAPLREPVSIDHLAQDCTQIPPEVTPAPALATTPVLPLEVRVMVEPADLTVAKDYMAVAAGVFERAGVRLKVRYDEVTAPAGWEADVLGAGPGSDALFAFMKDRYGGQRPRGVDLVYFMTRYWAGGMADCIGGVADPATAFAFGSVDYALEGAVPAPTANEGVIAAHELGHLLGAHHHYSNCAEALPSGATRGDTNLCTTMSPLATTASTTFGLLERSYVRYYVEKYARG